jgi:shikimate dehydrogenase
LQTPNRDTVLCMSLAARPGNFGVRFHNYLYRELGLNYYYKACTTTDLPAAIGGVRALGIRGCAVSMPFKEACIALVDELDESAAAIDSINTVVNTQGHLKAYNTDYMAVRQLLASHQVDVESSFALTGSGGMAKAVASALRDAGFRHGLIVARNAVAGQALATHCGYGWQAQLGEARPQLLINVTPVGMEGTSQAADRAFPRAAIEAAERLFDVVALPAETPAIALARELGKPVITGFEVAALQALEQFVLYTGVRPSDEQVQAAALYARG